MDVKKIKIAVSKVTGCNNQFRSNNKVDQQIKPLILAIGMMRMHGIDDDIIMLEMNVETEESYKRMCKLFDEWVYEGAIGKDQPVSTRAFRQINLIQTWLMLHRDEWIPPHKYIKV
jgi:hypothetical protein